MFHSIQEKIMQNINPFYIWKALDGIPGKVKNASWLKNGTLLVPYTVQVETHIGYPSIPPTGMSNEEIQSTLADQFISKAYRLIGKRDDKLFPLRTIFLTCSVLCLPISIHIGYERVSVCPYIPNPMPCF
jgi:hypothetical protein